MKSWFNRITFEPVAGFTLVLFALLGCDGSRQRAALDANDPVTHAVFAKALAQGKTIAGEAFALLSTNLLTALSQGGVSNALPYCSAQAAPLTGVVAARRDVAIRRITQRARNPANLATPAESAVLAQFESELAQNHPPRPWVTNLEPGQITFFAPIVITNALCLKCHGAPGTDIAAADVALIQSLYPADQATGYQLGVLRGAWRLDFKVAQF